MHRRDGSTRFYKTSMRATLVQRTPTTSFGASWTLALCKYIVATVAHEPAGEEP